VLEDIGADAVKIGMLGSAVLVRTVAERLRAHLGEGKTPIVLDPVMVAKSGAALLADDAVDALREELLPLATVVTPNLPELARLTGMPAGNDAERATAAWALAAKGPAVLAKGGHATGDEVVDLLVTLDGERRYVHPRLATTATHGTGCSLSSAIAARLGRGEALPQAVEGAIDYLTGAIAAASAAFPLGRPGGHGPVDHLYRMP
jgi:hydroxymethylpyrimidine/phosphomethylpyrimidine kinase